MVHLTVGVVNNVGKPWERVAYLMQNSVRAQKIPFLKKRKEKTQSCIIGLLFRFSQQGNFSQAEIFLWTFFKRGDCDKDRRHSACDFVWYEGRTACLAEVPRSMVIKRSTTQQCNVMLIVSCPKTGWGEIKQKARHCGVTDGTNRNTGRFLME